MYSKTKFALATALLAMTLNNVYGQNELNEITVTTTKLPQKEWHTSKSLVVIPDSVIHRTGMNVGELLQFHGGVTINGLNQPLGSTLSVFTRGASTGNTLILINGIPQNDPSTIEGSFDLNLINLANVKRIEVLKGGQSTLYGSDAVAGVINFITDELTENSFSGSLVAGSYGVMKVQGTGSVDLKGVQTTATLSGIKSKGFSSVGNQFKDEADGFKTIKAGLSLSKAFGDAKVEVFGNLVTNNASIDYAAFQDDADYTAESELWQVGERFNWLKDHHSISANFQLANQKRTYLNDSLSVADGAFDMYSMSTYNSNTIMLDIFDAFNYGYLSGVLGVDLRKHAMGQTYLSLSSYGPYEDVPLSTSDTKITNSSAYLNMKLGKDRGLGVELGSRLNIHSLYGFSPTFTFNPYFTSKKWTMYGVYATSFKNPSLYQLFSPYGDKDLKPELSRNVEAGVKFTIPQLQVTAAVFDRREENVITFGYPDANSFGQYMNLDTRNLDGIEVKVNTHLGIFSSSFNYNYLHTISLSKSNFINRFRIPKHELTGVVNAQLSKDLSLGLTGNYRSARKDSFNGETVELKSFFDLGFNANYQINNHLSVFGTVKNLLNAEIVEIYGFNSYGRNFLVGLNWK